MRSSWATMVDREKLKTARRIESDGKGGACYSVQVYKTVWSIF